MAKSAGRPMKYRHFITLLEDKVVYSPATIMRLGERHGLIDPSLSGQVLKNERLKIRHALARFSTNHGFPIEGDGMIYLHGQPPIRGWYGWRWKEALPDL